MENCEFYNVEVMDGYFSGVAFIYDNKMRYIVDITYDIEFEKLNLKNCSDIMYNSFMEEHSFDELEELKSRNYIELKNEILKYIEANGYLVFADH